MRPETEHYTPAHYGTYGYHPLRQRRGMTADESVANAGKIRASLLAEGLPLLTVQRWMLDNPYMSDDARAVMANMARRFRVVRRESRGLAV